MTDGLAVLAAWVMYGLLLVVLCAFVLRGDGDGDGKGDQP